MKRPVPSIPSIKGKGKSALGLRVPFPTDGPLLYNGVGMIYNDNAITYNQG
jgi:hypothetical protein